MIPIGKVDRLARRAAAALLEHRTHRAAADAIGVPVVTFKRWTRRQAFKGELARLAAEAYSTAGNRLRGLADVAVETLHAGMAGTAKPSQIRAATAVLELAANVELAALAERVARLEAGHDAVAA